MTSRKCLEWRNQPLINPLTGRSIKQNGPTYRLLEEKCGDMRRQNRRSPSPRQRSPSPGSNRQSQEIYCGNNARDQGLQSGLRVLGSRYQCLKKGIGRGLKEPILEYNEDYEPIEQLNVFCGNGDILPQHKERFGTRDECLRKGFAVGQKQKYDRDGGIQRVPVVSRERGWYKVYLPSNMGPVQL